MSVDIDKSLNILDKFLSVINTRKKAYTLILLWVLGVSTYGAVKLFSVETIERVVIHNKCHHTPIVIIPEVPIVPSL